METISPQKKLIKKGPIRPASVWLRMLRKHLLHAHPTDVIGIYFNNKLTTRRDMNLADYGASPITITIAIFRSPEPYPSHVYRPAHKQLLCLEQILLKHPQLMAALYDWTDERKGRQVSNLFDPSRPPGDTFTLILLSKDCTPDNPEVRLPTEIPTWELFYSLKGYMNTYASDDNPVNIASGSQNQNGTCPVIPGVDTNRGDGDSVIMASGSKDQHDTSQAIPITDTSKSDDNTITVDSGSKDQHETFQEIQITDTNRSEGNTVNMASGSQDENETSHKILMAEQRLLALGDLITSLILDYVHHYHTLERLRNTTGV